jgi:hypothetical protein
MCLLKPVNILCSRLSSLVVSNGGKRNSVVQRVPTFATVSVPYYKLITIFACLPVTMMPKEY